MTMKMNLKTSAIVICMAIMITIVLAITMATEAYAATGTVSDKAGLNMRSGPGTEYSILTVLNYGETLNIIESEKDKDGDIWYKIIANGSYGYVFSQYVDVKEDIEYTPDQSFEEQLTAQGFPESYKDYLRNLHVAYPNWVFKAHKTGLQWNDVIAKESVVGRNLVHSSSPESWKSKEYGAYDPSTGQYVIFDSGGWVSASEGIIKYYMDPRNFINETGVFQFMAHSFDAQTQTKEGLQKLVADTFMAGTFPEKNQSYNNKTYGTYSELLMDAGIKAGANPYVLASMIITEQGRNGSGNSISGRVSGYEGYYNFFNIRAYAHSGRDAVENGLIYAKGSGSYERPWNSRIKSIIGGAIFYAEEYINNNQDTQYLKKFNVMNGLNSVATHQYMTNVKGAAQEAADLKSGYTSIIDSPLTFYIPVYNNMPDVTCAQPGSGNNDYFLKSLAVAGYQLTPTFDMYRTDYELLVPATTSHISIDAAARDSGAKVTGGGKVALTGDVTKVTIVVTASSGATKKYNITIAKQAQPQGGLESSKYQIGEYVTGVDFDTTVRTFKNNISVPAGHILKVTNVAGKEITDGNVATGMNVVLYDENNKAIKNINIVIRGDVNGDGKITSVDPLMTKRYIIKTYDLKGAYFAASDINQDGKVTSVDALYMKRHIIKTYEIKN